VTDTRVSAPGKPESFSRINDIDPSACQSHAEILPFTVKAALMIVFLRSLFWECMLPLLIDFSLITAIQTRYLRNIRAIR
jgi:hypothetical protein